MVRLMVFQSIYNLNLEAFKVADSVASPFLNHIMPYFIDSFYIVLPIIAIYMYLKKDKNVYSFAFTAVALYIICDILKLIVQEPRPCNVPDLSFINHVGCEASYSFPSEHAMVLSGVSLFTANYKYLRWLYLIWLVAVLFGKIYLGQHYLTDIIVGAALGLVIARIIYSYRTKLNKHFEGIALSILRTIRVIQ